MAILNVLLNISHWFKFPKSKFLFKTAYFIHFITYIQLTKCIIPYNHNQVVFCGFESPFQGVLSHLNIYLFTAVNLKKIRIPGVLQRFSLTYMVLGLFEVCFSRYDTPEKYQVHYITDILKLLFWKVKTWYTVNSELNVRY